MKSAAQRYDLGLRGIAGTPRPLPRKLECRLVRLRARIAEENFRGERPAREILSKLLTGISPVKIARVNESRRKRIRNCALDAGVAVAKRVHTDPADEIEITLPG